MSRGQDSLVVIKPPVTRADGIVGTRNVGKLAHLGKPGTPRPAWVEIMARKRRKTLVVCAHCHDSIHHRHPTTTPNTE
jgi:hypothetical protein